MLCSKKLLDFKSGQKTKYQKKCAILFNSKAVCSKYRSLGLNPISKCYIFHYKIQTIEIQAFE